MKALKSLYMTLTVLFLLATTYFLCQKDFHTDDTLAGFACLCASFFFFILFGKVCQKIEEENSQNKPKKQPIQKSK